MKYIYEIESKNYEDFASGRVLYNQQGATAFPVRLASEIFLRSKSYLSNKNINTPITVYDPCCGGAYLLTILGFLHGKYIRRIIGSDVDDDILSLANRNLSLLTNRGINKRIMELKKYIDEYNKLSHINALNSATKLKSLQKNINRQIEIDCFKADVLVNFKFMFEEKVDLILTDLPYGNITKWSSSNENNLQVFLENMLIVLKPSSILTIITDKKQKIKNKNYNRIKHITIGKRRISFLEPIM